MGKCLPSIFNDVIGPVMRGPSSSHVAGASRIASLIRMSVDNKVKKVIVDFDTNGSLAESYDGHGSDIGFVSGILGIDLKDNRVPKALQVAKEEGVEIVFNILDYGAVHPNNYRMKITSRDGVEHTWEAISVGGGMIQIQKFEGFEVSIWGDYHETLIIATEENGTKVKNEVIEKIGSYDVIEEKSKEGKLLINIKTSKKVEKDLLKDINEIEEVITLEPILPTHSSASSSVPFTTAQEMLEVAKKEKREMWEMALLYESTRGNTSEQEVFDKMYEIVCIMSNCIEEGLKGTSYADRILEQQSNLIENGMKNKSLLPTDLINNVIKSITSIMEVKSSMGVIVAAPTVGSCGCLPGTILGIVETLEMTKEDATKALLAAGLIGIFICEGATFAAEVAGCQVECGAGSGMAAAGIVQLLNGSVEQCVNASSMALQHVTGLACDPVANRVEVPCLGKNVMGGVNAIAAANMSIAGYDKVIPLDETIEAMYEIGKMLPIELRCTFGGLGKTKTSCEIRKGLENIETVKN